jgi:enterochelin esterase-like enzyme
MSAVACALLVLRLWRSEVTEVPYVRYPLESPSRYAHGPDSYPQPDVPRGTLDEYEWNDSSVFPGTQRRYWVYVPAQYRETEPASVMVFQDADWYLNPDLNDRAAVVFDNLIHQGAMPVTIGVFVAPGEPGRRNAEYDAFSDAYATFLLDELLPAVRAGYAITNDPEQWAVGGGSSGGNCAFTVGWMRPDRFRRVLSFVPSFPQLDNGTQYPQLIRETPAKPLRILLQTVSRDIGWNSPEHNHFSEGLKVAAALAERGYDFRLVLGEGAHDGNHSGVILPDALRWLWHPKPRLEQA